MRAAATRHPRIIAALLLSLAIHTGLSRPWLEPDPPTPPPDELAVQIRIAPEPAPEPEPAPPSPAEIGTRAPPASLAAPPAPSAEEWALAATYTLKNSKRYRHTLGQQIRSMMGTAVAGPGQGMVRFRFEVAPDGHLAHVEMLWSTSEEAEKRAWQAIRTLPPLPPTPTGKPLVFEKTIAFVPYETGWPPSYKMDCLPDPPAFKNPFAWDGKSPPPRAPKPPEGDPAPPGDCPADENPSSLEDEERELKRQMELLRWGR